MALPPPPRKEDQRFDNWVFTLWKRAVSALVSGGVGATSPITITTSGTGTVNIGHGTSGVVTGTYGSQSRIPIVAVDTYGHLTLATSSDVAIAGTAVTGANLTVSSPLTGTATNALLRAGTIGHSTSGVLPGTYGASGTVGRVVVDTYGHVTSAAGVAIDHGVIAGLSDDDHTQYVLANGARAVTGTLTMANVAIQTAADVTATTPILLSGTTTSAVLHPFVVAHATSGAIPATYGNQSTVPIITVNTYGHITSATSSAIALSGTAITGANLTVSSPLVGTVTNALLRAGTVAHGTSGVIGGTYGGALGVPRVVIDTYGHITSATNVSAPIVQNIQNGTYTLVAADANKHLYREGTATGVAQWVIPSNAEVSFDIGAPVTMVNDGTGDVTVSINSDTLVFAGTGATGSRTLPQYGMASVLKVASTRWFISGAGVS